MERGRRRIWGKGKTQQRKVRVDEGKKGLKIGEHSPFALLFSIRGHTERKRAGKKEKRLETVLLWSPQRLRV